MTQTNRRKSPKTIRSKSIHYRCAALFCVLGAAILALGASTAYHFAARPVLRVTSMQTGKNGVLTSKVESVGTITAPDPAFAISPQESMLVMKLTVTNTSNQKQHFIPVTQLYVRSADGDYSALHPSMHVQHPLPASDLKPGQSTSGEITFAIPKNLATPLLYVDTGWNNAPPIIIDVFH